MCAYLCDADLSSIASAAANVIICVVELSLTRTLAEPVWQSSLAFS